MNRTLDAAGPDVSQSAPFEGEIDVLVVIVCYRATQLTIDCLRSLEGEVAGAAGLKVGVCENGTGGSSAAELRAKIESEGWSGWAYVKEIHPNRGFTGGNNAILDDAMRWERRPSYFLLLNSDTIVRRGAIAAMRRAMDQRPDVGIVGPRLDGDDGAPLVSNFRFISPASEFIRGARTGLVTRLLRRFEVPVRVFERPIEPPWTSFACALIRRAVCEQIGVLDEGYYLYFDDVDFCRRARRAGWQIQYCPEAHVTHLVGQSNPVESLAAEHKRRPKYFYRSRSRYFGKFYGRAGLWVANFMWYAGRSIALSRRCIGRGVAPACDHEWRDVWINAATPMKVQHDTSAGNIQEVDTQELAVGGCD